MDYKFDKTAFKATTFEEADRQNVFDASVPIGERLRQAWYLTCKAYGIDPENPPKMDKTVFSSRKHAK